MSPTPLTVSLDRLSINDSPSREFSCPPIIYTIQEVVEEQFKTVKLIEGDNSAFLAAFDKKKSLSNAGEKGELKIEELLTLASGYASALQQDLFFVEETEKDSQTIAIQELSEILPFLIHSISKCDEPQQWLFLLAFREVVETIKAVDIEGEIFTDEQKSLSRLSSQCTELLVKLQGEKVLYVQKNVDRDNTMTYNLSSLGTTFSSIVD